MTLDNAALIPVMASLVPTPLAVRDATPASNWSTPTPAAFAVGATPPMLDASSPKVVFPLFWVIRNWFASPSASLVAIPYAFRVDVSPSTAVVVSVNPPFAALTAVPTKSTTWSDFAPADRA